MDPVDNLAIITAAPRRWTFRGRDYLASRLSPRAAGELQALIMDMHPDPRKQAREFMDGHTPEMQKYIYDKACEDARTWPPNIDSAAGLRVLMSPRGLGLLVFLALHKNHPEITRDEAVTFASQLTIDETMELVSLMLPGGDSSPKVEPTTMSSETGQAGARSSSDLSTGASAL